MNQIEPIQTSRKKQKSPNLNYIFRELRRWMKGTLCCSPPRHMPPSHEVSEHFFCINVGTLYVNTYVHTLVHCKKNNIL